MKKILSLALALVLVLGLSITAFADPITNLDSAANASQNVEAAYTAATDKSSGTVYYVTVAWTATGDGQLAYTGEQAVYTWNGSTMQYAKNTSHENYVAAGWSGSSGYKVTVTNQSNGSIEVATSATNTYNLTLTEPENKTATVTTAAVNEEGTIEITETGKTGTPQIAEFTYTYAAKAGADAPTGDTNATITVGTISVTISKSA